MSLREFLLYPPFFIFASLALAIVLTFLFFILHQRRKIKKLRRGMKGAAQPADAGQKLPSPEEPVPAQETAVPPLRTSPSTVLLEEPPAVIKAAVAVPDAAPAESPSRQDAMQAPIAEWSQPPGQELEVAKPGAEPVRHPQPAPEALRTAGPALPQFRTFDRKTGLSADLLRAGLILLAFTVTLAFGLVLLPESAFQGMADSIRYRRSGQPQQEQLAFLYLGDEVKGTELHIRGVVRNISARPIEQLDATIRLYAPDRTLLETAVVRMDWEEIAPNATATFHLSYADYHGQFGSYSVDFKLRQGEPVPYKDVRGVLTAK